MILTDDPIHNNEIKSVVIQSEMTILTGPKFFFHSKLDFGKSRCPIFGQGNTPIRFVSVETRDHLDALDDGADRVAESAPCAGVIVNLETRGTEGLTKNKICHETHSENTIIQPDSLKQFR